jgi:serine/threonine protein phosphatase PrpC
VEETNLLKTFSITDIGRKRKVNQDFVYSSERFVGPLPNLFLVADGMGGHNAGDYASRLAVETIVERSSGSLETNPLRVLDEAVQSANGLVRKRAQETPELQGMGTTVVAAVIDGRELYVANVGDSRLYIVNSGEIRQITKDHSWVEEMVRRGGIGKAEARNHPDKNIITRAVGAEETVRIDFFQVLLQEGDVILMCTDGLTNMLEDEEIRMTLDGARDIVEKAQGLVRAANERGGRDNISVVLIEFI